jgi:hypothetical protein
VPDDGNAIPCVDADGLRSKRSSLPEPRMMVEVMRMLGLARRPVAGRGPAP